MASTIHPQAEHFLRRRLFSGLNTFDELEGRIRALRTLEAQQSAFHVFVIGFLMTRAIFQARAVWPREVIPETIQQRIVTAELVDGVLQTSTGEFHAYQTSFHPLGHAFHAEAIEVLIDGAGEFDSHLIVTNVEDVQTAETVEGSYYVVSRRDFDELTADDFHTIEAWLKGKPLERKRHELRWHQPEAVEKTVMTIAEHDRCKVLAACGSGKTFVALRTCERLDPGGEEILNILVLLPSLALIRQVLAEWMEQTYWSSVSFLCVCSDPTVANGGDAIAPTQADLDFPVGTDPRIVTRYLTTASTRVRLVISTYQSAPVVAEGMPEGFRFDIGVFDEAHVTAGVGERLQSFALLDDNLPIAKRIFYTATPRHHKVRGRGEGVEEVPVFSMDNEKLYGPTAHELSFREAIRRGIITDYRIIVTVITSRMLNLTALEDGMVGLPSGRTAPAKVIAGQVGLKRAAGRFGMRKVFSFHQLVAGAKQFTDPEKTLIGELLPEFALFHVNGMMTAAERERALKAFREAQHAVMSNARCLSVGVNVPTVDGVMFQDRRGDMVDVVQATGRAMRRAEGKAFGYVILPIYVEQGADETLEAALARSDFQLVWDVLQALREQDHLLTIEIGKKGSGRGRPKPDDEDEEEDGIVTIDAPELEQAIGAICVDGLFDKRDHRWWKRFDELRAYKALHGHCNVPCGWTENPELANWVSNQRVEYKAGKLSAERIALLEAEGFVWDPLEAIWYLRLAELRAFKAKAGHCNVPHVWKENQELAHWVGAQRQAYKAGKLSAERIALLEAEGFVWNTDKALWFQRLAELRAYKALHGNCYVPTIWQENQELANWVGRQRQAYKAGKLSAERIALLEAVGIKWNLAKRPAYKN